MVDRWGLTLGPAYEGGTAGFVTAAIDQLDRRCVLKIAMPLDMDEVEAFRRSVKVHQLANGRGCAVLHDYDESVPAMLLEQLGPNLHQLGLDLPHLLRTITTTLGDFWQPVTPDCGLPTGAEKAAWLESYIVTTWGDLGRPCTRDVIDLAVEFCAQRAVAFDPASSVLVHGDAHGWNTVAAGPSGYRFVDPEGIVSERAHDLGVPMREYNEPLLAGDTKQLVRERAELLAEWADVDPQAVWQWGYIERVSTGLAGVRDFEDDSGRMMLEVAERCL